MKYQIGNIKNIPCRITCPKINYLGINLNKEVKNLYAENYKTLIKDKECDSKKRTVIP